MDWADISAARRLRRGYQPRTRLIMTERDQEPRPRRDDWDDSWEQRADDPRFTEQVSWELDMLDAADIVIMYLAPGTKSPVSLLELGLCARSGKLRVCCPPGFWRRGNVELVCGRNRIPLFETLDDLIADLKAATS